MSESNQYNEQNINNHQLSGTSPNFRTDLAKKLEELVPEAIADGKVDVVKLKELLAEDAGEPNERFGLFWPGKKQALRAAQEPTTATLKPAKDESKDWDTTNNIFIEGDNLEVLKVLQKQYHNSIKMIYIDPPYNTGKDFVYPDNFKEGLQNYLEFSQQVDEGNKKISTNTETAGRYHSNWLNMMYPRLKLARNLLTDDGVIFISIDDNEYAHLRKLCDEVFGENNFIASISWQRKKEIANDTRGIAIQVEYILAYSRTPNIELAKKPLSKDYIDSAYKYSDSRGVWRPVPITLDMGHKGGGYEYSITTPTGSVITRKWRMPEVTYKSLVKNDEIYFGKNSNGIPQRKKYLDGNSGTFYSNLWYDLATNKTGKKEVANMFGVEVFNTVKPTRLIEEMLHAACDKDCLVLDFFAGSATTAHAVMQLNAEDGGNRKHIMVQLPEPTDEKSEAFKAGYKKISDIARERINRAGEKIKADFADKLAERETPLDVGYRTYKLADTNFTKWQSAPTGDLTELQARLDLMRESSNDNASEEDLLVEVLLKMGLPLTTRTRTVDVDGFHVHQVVTEGDSSEGQPVLYLNEHVKPTLEQLRAIITDLIPSKFVILDDAFQGDNQLKTNLVQTCKSYDVELWTV